jgi:alpha 1,2-mannosyltransferase
MTKKNCIIYLVRTSEKDLEDLNKSLELLDKNLLAFTPTVDVILFHESSFDESYKQRVCTLFAGQVYFNQIQFPDPPAGAPEIFPHPIPEQVAMGNLGFSIGYRHMCWFFSGGMYYQEVLKDYKFYLRLDTDSYILTELNYDIFEKMRGKKYGYIKPAIQQDNPAVVEGLWEFVGDSYNVKDIPEGRMYYTNFEIGDLEWFRQKPYMDFFKRIEQSGNIYHKRWGDAPIKFLGVNLFIQQYETLSVEGFTYQHGAVYEL